MAFLRFLLLVWPLELTALIFQSSNINQYGAVNFTLQVNGGESECASLLARGDLEILNTILTFNSNGVPYASAADMFVQVKLLNENAEVVNCVQYGGFDLETPECGIAGKWPVEWNTNSGTYTEAVNVSKAGLAGETWSICVGNGWTGASGAVSYIGQVVISPVITYAVPSTFAPSLAPSMAPTQATMSASPTVVPTQAPSTNPTVTYSPTTIPIQLESNCGEPIVISFDAHLSGGQSVCVDFGANGSVNALALNLTFSGSVSGEKASDFGTVLYSTHFHKGIQYGGYNYYLDGVTYITGWPESFNSRSSGTYEVDQVVNISPPFNIDGDYYRFCIFNGWSLAEKVTYSGTIDLSNSLSLNCDVIPPDLTPTVSPTPQPTLTSAPTGIIDRGIYPAYEEPQYPVVFIFDLNLTSGAFVCSPIVQAYGNLSSLSTLFHFFTENDISWASDMLVTLRLIGSLESCSTVGGADVSADSTCQGSPIVEYLWPKSFQSNRVGNYNATIDLTALNYGSSSYEVCITNGFEYDDGSIASYRGRLSLTGLYISEYSQVPTSAPTLGYHKNNGDDDSNSLSFETVLLMAILIPIGVGTIILVSYFVIRKLRKKSSMNETLINENVA